MAGWRIRQVPGGWVIVPPDGSRLETLLAGAGGVSAPYDSRPRALRALVAAATADQVILAAGTVGDGLLDETWESDAGIAFSEPTGPERDFTGVAWSWRDPLQTLVPLMLQQVTAAGHDEAELAGFVTAIFEQAGTVHGAGRFYANDAGGSFRDLLLDGRRFGVSVDPGEETDAEWSCTEYDEDEFCIAGRLTFTRYEIAGLTGTPFPGFARASIRLAPVRALEPALVASGGTAATGRLPAFTVARGGISYARAFSRYDAPPAEFFHMAEPDVGGPLAHLLVEQEDGSFGVPLTIEESGRVFGHVARWGQCHTGYLDECVQAPPSTTGYAGFHLGLTRLDNGEQIATGNVTAGCDHASIRLRAPEARSHYDHSGTTWSTVRALDGALGIWICGALRPDVTDLEADLLRSLNLSGDWRRDRGIGAFEMLAVLGVNVPGFPQRRQASLVASGSRFLSADTVVDQPLALWLDGDLEALVASGITRRARCGCGGKHAGDGSAARIEALEAQVAALTRLTRGSFGPST